jgi:hypothetical protein
MKTKTLTEEIQRIKILMEAPVESAGIYTAIGDIIMKLSDEFTDLASKNSVVKKLFDDLGRATTNDESFNILMKLIKESPQLADQIIPRITDALDITQKLDLVKTKMINLLSKSPNLRPDLVINDFFEQVGIVGGKLLDDELDKIVKSRVIDEVMNGYKPTPIIPVKVTPGSASEQLSSVLKKWDEIKPGTLTVSDKLAMNDLWFRGLRAKIKVFIDNLVLKEEKTYERIASLLKTAAASTDNFSGYSQLMRTINAEIESLRNTPDFLKENILNIISREINTATGSQKGTEIVGLLRKNDPYSKDAQSYFKYLLDDTDISLLKPPLDATWWINLVNRIFTMFTTGMFKTTQGLYREYIAKYGSKKGLWKLYKYLQIMNKVFWPTVFAFYDWAKTAIFGTQDEGFNETLLSHFKQRLQESFNIYFEGWWKIDGSKTDLSKAALTAIWPFDWWWDGIFNGLESLTIDGFINKIRNMTDDVMRRINTGNEELPSIEDEIDLGTD